MRVPLFAVIITLSLFLPSRATHAENPSLPVTPILFIDAFQGAEGIGFSAEGKLFIAANKAVWLAGPDGSVTKLATTDSNLGIHRIGDRDILMADFGPTVALGEAPANDGVIWRISPDGTKTEFARGIADPNAILVLDDGKILVSDDFTPYIYEVTRNGDVSIWSDAIPFPNGMALSSDGNTLYVAQIFTTIETRPVGFADAIWAMPIADGKPAGEAKVVVRTGGIGGVDGLAADEHGRIYIAANQDGRIWRFDPSSGELTLVAENMPHVASLVFGEGDFDHESIYATSTFKGGGKIWRIPVGVKGRRVNR